MIPEGLHLYGTNAGTGQPSTFACRRYRQENYRERHPAAWKGHKVVRTGLEKPYYGYKGGVRMTDTLRQYRCECGYVGWSAHVELSRYPVNGAPR